MSWRDNPSELQDVATIWSADVARLAALEIRTEEELIRRVQEDAGLSSLSEASEIPVPDLSRYYETARLGARRRQTRRRARWLSLVLLPALGALTTYHAITQRPVLSECQTAYADLYGRFQRAEEDLEGDLAQYRSSERGNVYLTFLSSPDAAIEFPGCNPEPDEQAVVANILQLVAAWHDRVATDAILNGDLNLFAEQAGLAQSLLNELERQPSHQRSAVMNQRAAAAQQKLALRSVDSQSPAARARLATRLEDAQLRLALMELEVNRTTNASLPARAPAEAMTVELDTEEFLRGVKRLETVAGRLENIASSVQQSATPVLSETSAGPPDPVADLDVDTDADADADSADDADSTDIVTASRRLLTTGCLDFDETALAGLLDTKDAHGVEVFGYTYRAIDDGRLLAKVDGPRARSTTKTAVRALLESEEIRPDSEDGICKVRFKFCDERRDSC